MVDKNQINDEVKDEVKESEKDEATLKETEEDKEKTKKPQEKKNKKSKEQIKIETLEAEIIKMQLEMSKDREDYLKARADLENTQKRIKEQAIQDRKYASIDLITDLINPVDMLDKASSMETNNQEMKNFLIGFKMIANQIVDILKRDGLEEIEALGKPFDSNLHQAMSTEHKDGVEPGIVLEVIQSGFKYKDRLVKPAMVKVSE